MSKKLKAKKLTKAQNGSGMTRRTALKLGAAAGVVTVLTSRKSLAQALPAIPPEPADCTPQPTNSPATRPFVQALPIPSIAIPTILNPQPTLSANTAAGEAPRADHQDFAQFFPLVQYDISIQPTLHQFHPDIPATYCWGYNGIYPGPTFLGVYGLPSLVRFHNNLPVNHNGFGTNTHTTHLHNGHTASESDGFAADFWGPGFFKDHHYPNVYAGFNANPPIGDPLEAQYTYWYHDHRHSFTATNNYRGLNGMYLLFDSHDNGLGFPTSDGDSDHDDNVGLPGPYGVYDIPLILTDKLFCPDGQMFATAPDAVPAGDKFIVNGVIQPFFQVQQRKYRFRVLNTGPARIWLLNIVDNNGNVVPFQVVATDGNLLPSPVTLPNAQETAISAASFGGGAGLNVFVSQRYDIVVDFTNATAGTSWFLTNNQAQFVNNGPEPDAVAPGLEVENVVMRFDITGPPPSPDRSVVPNVLTALPNISGPLANLADTRVWNFNLALAGPEGDPENPNAARVFNINGLTFDGNRADATMAQGSAETWLIRNRFPGSGWVHPVHIHLEEGRVLDRRTVQIVNGVRTITNHFVPPLQQGRRDVYPVGGGDEILVFLQFRDWFGKYMIHCHNLGHEDGLMLVRWDVGTTTSPSTSPVYSDGNANTGNVTEANGTVVTVPEEGAQRNITPALTTLSDSFDLGGVKRPAVRRSRKGVNA